VPKPSAAPVLRPIAPVPAAKPVPVAGSGVVRASGVVVAPALPTGAKPAPGMARLEALLHTAGSRLKPAAPPTAPVKAIPAVARPVVAAAAKPSAAAVAVAAEVVEILEPEVVAEVVRDVPTITPAATAPAGGKPKTGRRVEEESERKKTRYKSRKDRDEDDDDRSPGRKTRGGTLVFALILGGILFVACAVGAVFLITSLVSDDGTDTAANAQAQSGNNFNAQPNRNPLPPFRVPDPAPAPNNPLPNNIPPVDNNPVPNVPFPNNPRPAPQAQLVWRPVAGDGFTAEMPAAVQESPHWHHVHSAAGLARGGFIKADGKKYTANVVGEMFEVSYVDLPPGYQADLKQIVTPFGHEHVNVAACQFAGQPGLGFSKPFGPWTETKRLVQVGRRVYLFSARVRSDEAGRRFFDSVKLTDAPAGQGAAAGGLGGDNPAGPGVRQQDPPADPGPNARSLTAVTRIEPFWAAAVLSTRSEVLVFGARTTATGKPGGWVRRYTYPGFVAKNTYHLPYPVTNAVADEAAGKLVVTTSIRPEITQKETERQVHVGDVHVYDLNPLLDGSIGERDEVKPVATVPLGARLAGLELVGGKAVVLAVSGGAAMTKVWKARLVRIDPATGRSGPDLELPDPVWRLRAAPDGSRLYVAEAQLTPAGLPIWGAARNGYVMTVDVKGWKREKTYSVPGMAYDFAVGGDGKLLVSVSQGRDVKLFAVSADDQTVDLNPADGRAVSLGYAALTPDGKQMVTAQPRELGADVYEVANLTAPSGLKKAAGGRTVRPAKGVGAEVPIGGYFTVTPDGKFALFQCGVVLDLGKAQAN